MADDNGFPSLELGDIGKELSEPVKIGKLKVPKYAVVGGGVIAVAGFAWFTRGRGDRAARSYGRAAPEPAQPIGAAALEDRLRAVQSDIGGLTSAQQAQSGGLQSAIEEAAHQLRPPEFHELPPGGFNIKPLPLPEFPALPELSLPSIPDFSLGSAFQPLPQPSFQPAAPLSVPSPAVTPVTPDRVTPGRRTRKAAIASLLPATRPQASVRTRARDTQPAAAGFIRGVLGGKAPRTAIRPPPARPAAPRAVSRPVPPIARPGALAQLRVPPRPKPSAPPRPVTPRRRRPIVSAGGAVLVR